ncbi:ceramide synthase 2-like [Convolutriloba macropyga]|uniref:ceramide synthase 2-like n=1 Tax=Convolutriloba macropyga TaxID=536237 RepID=UPI003F525312
MPNFTINEVGSSLALTGLLIVIRKITETTVADWAIRTFAQPGCDILRNPKTEHKYREGCWKLFIHAWIVTYGLVVLLPTDFLYDSRQLWIDALNHRMTPVQYWYYMIELGYYCSEVLTHCVSVKRKDFFMMLLHHVVTLLLIIVSYHNNMFRVGLLMMLFHDLMDPFLELAKIGKYLKLKKFSYFMFVLLTITYFYTRLYLIPFYIWRSVIYEVPDILMSTFDSSDGYFWVLYYFCNLLIGILMVLNCIWAYFLMAAIVRFTSGRELADTRSDDEHND